jgi:RNA polymerase sigma-70 factor, ECF subfamily
MNQQQYENAFLLYYLKVFRYCYKSLRIPQDAEDIAMTAFLALGVALPAVKPESVENYLMVIARHKCVDVKRRASICRFTSLTKDLEAAETPYNHERDLMAGQAAKAMERLPKQQRQAVMLRHIHDLDREEIARIMGKSKMTARNHIAAGLVNLRKLMQ